ncbi:MAG: LOW QUALITY PROTEIN: uncharacterized protein KVP18_002332 [Porospora cf. gigantea A]|uniref:uncharacterized protein n=1 Tax=Porospora cf. gigantea A TaxID=2853593 RepID=UPI003559CBB1|nr:MAG: LOW QUALITY PROTEIN: hypothetical protein KVP18_002332 [Porospora cf. gigantea A]
MGSIQLEKAATPSFTLQEPWSLDCLGVLDIVNSFADESPAPFVVDDIDFTSLCFNSSTETLTTAFRDRLDRLHQEVAQSRSLRQLHDTDLPLASLANPKTDVSAFVGSVVPEADGRLTRHAAVLEEPQSGCSAQLLLEGINDFFIYPNQLLRVFGTCTTGLSTKLRAEAVASGFSAPPPPAPVDQTLTFEVVCPPYTSPKNLAFVLLEKKLHQCRANTVLVLGPLVEPTHPMVLSGVLRTSKEDFVSDIDVAARFFAKLKGPTKYLYVPHSDDVLCPFPFPSPPIPEDSLVTCCTTNPLYLRSASVSIMATSRDLLTPIIRNSARENTADRLELACREILSQRTLIPALSVTCPLGNLASLPAPTEHHVLVFKSRLPAFSKVVYGRLFVNMGMRASMGRVQIRAQEGLQAMSVAMYKCDL